MCHRKTSQRTIDRASKTCPFLACGFAFVDPLGYSLTPRLSPDCAETFGASLTLAGLLSTANTSARSDITNSADESNRSRGSGTIGAAFGLELIISPATESFLSHLGYTTPAPAVSAVTLLNPLALILWLPEALSERQLICIGATLLSLALIFRAFVPNAGLILIMLAPIILSGGARPRQAPAGCFGDVLRGISGRPYDGLDAFGSPLPFSASRKRRGAAATKRFRSPSSRR